MVSSASQETDESDKLSLQINDTMSDSRRRQRREYTSTERGRLINGKVRRRVASESTQNNSLLEDLVRG